MARPGPRWPAYIGDNHASKNQSQCDGVATNFVAVREEFAAISPKADTSAKDYLAQRDEHYREFGRLLIEAKELHKLAGINTPWKEWSATEFGVSYETIARRMRDAKDPAAADERREDQRERDQKVSRNRNLDTPPPVKGSPVDPTDETKPVEAEPITATVTGTTVQDHDGHVIGVLTVNQIKRAIQALPRKEQEVISKWLGKHLSEPPAAEAVGAKEQVEAPTAPATVKAPVAASTASFVGRSDIPFKCDRENGICGKVACKDIGCCQWDATDALPLGTPARKPVIAPEDKVAVL